LQARGKFQDKITKIASHEKHSGNSYKLQAERYFQDKMTNYKPREIVKTKLQIAGQEKSPVHFYTLNTGKKQEYILTYVNKEIVCT
jgi:hypothetical protein